MKQDQFVIYLLENPCFELVSEFAPTGDQPQAIEQLVQGIQKKKIQTLLGVTGSGKTFTVANAIAKTGKKTLVISHNKTLAAQLYAELKQFFPRNNVGYFVSYYDYYQPESYIAQTDTYIEKDTQINEKIEKLRLEATAMLLSGEPTIIVATVSCIYSLGSPSEWETMAITIEKDAEIGRSSLIKKLVNARYDRNDTELLAGRFRIKGDTIDVIPAYSDSVVRISLFGDEVEKISICDPVSLQEKKQISKIKIYPAKHYLVAADVRKIAVQSIRNELKQRLTELPELERQRLEMRTKYDLEMIEELGYCSGIENYSRHFDGRNPGEPPFCLLDFFGEDFLLVIDESHVTLPQLHGMYNGDHTRKKSLIDYGFRLTSAFDNRPLKFEEFERYIKNTIFVSATPGDYERKQSFQIVEQLVRPTGLVDPTIEVRKTENQMDDLILEIKKRTDKDQRILVTTLTKRMAEDLAEYLSKHKVKVRYLHSEIENLQRTEIIRQLRLGEFDVLVGINLLREGLDIPEVSLVAILDADKEGFLRNVTSLIQTCGRAARNVDGAVIMYADKKTQSMALAISETDRRRSKQVEYNKKMGITPTSITKAIPQQTITLDETKHMSKHDIQTLAIEIEATMKRYAEDLDFEHAIEYRDKLTRIQKQLQNE
ncbi:MAG TPA: excinuclease ABC subunit UvrB [Candidatus Nitrosotalea sp.]|nr:excinuclease ABC subunit UvrB [Candidatus Nitrosotalea sp.]